MRAHLVGGHEQRAAKLCIKHCRLIAVEQDIPELLQLRSGADELPGRRQGGGRMIVGVMCLLWRAGPSRDAGDSGSRQQQACFACRPPRVCSFGWGAGVLVVRMQLLTEEQLLHGVPGVSERRASAGPTSASADAQ